MDSWPMVSDQHMLCPYHAPTHVVALTARYEYSLLFIRAAECQVLHLHHEQAFGNWMLTRQTNEWAFEIMHHSKLF